MVLNIKNQRLSKSDLESGKFNENIFSTSELLAVKLAKAWLSGEKKFRINTSGSTGKPKEIHLDREVLEYSARKSMEYLDPEFKFRTALLCISPEYIGGLMVVIRSLIFDYELTVIEPGSNPLNEIGAKQFDLVSMVPLQVQSCLDKQGSLSAFKTILIGGAPLNDRYVKGIQKTDCVCYQTYGMTETASHVALKNLTEGETVFKTLGDMQIETDDRGCLKLKGTATNNEWLQTRDIVEISGPQEFRWLGRADFVINTGGYKVHPEILEQRIAWQIPEPFFITGIADNKFGERVVLLIEGSENKRNFDLSTWHPYERPKEIFYLPDFKYTPSGKINRQETLKLIRK